VSFGTCKEVAIRKPRKCQGCRDEHPAGTKMVYPSGKDDDSFYSTYLCLTCAAYLDKYADDFFDGFESGSLRAEDPDGWEMVAKEQKGVRE